MHLHDRHEAHLTLQTALKQARQSLAQGLCGRGSAGFPYSVGKGVNSLGFIGVFVNFSLRCVTQIFHFGKFCRTSAN
jgi:hypothetical protein